MAIGPVQDAASRIGGNAYVQVQRPVTAPADTRAAETEERRERIPSQTGPSRDGREEQIQPGSRVTRSQDGDMAVISPEGVAYVEQAAQRAQRTEETDEEVRETAAQAVGPTAQGVEATAPQGGTVVRQEAVQGVGPAVPQGGNAPQGAGPAVQQSGTVVPGAGTAVQGTGPAVQQDGTVVQGAGTAVQGTGAAAQQGGTMVPDSVRRTGGPMDEEEQEQKASTEKLANYSVSKLKQLYQDRAITKVQYDEAMEVKQERTDKEEEEREEDQEDQLRTRMQTKTQTQSQKTGNERAQNTTGTGRRTVQPGARVLEAYNNTSRDRTAAKGNALSQEMARDILIAAAMKTSERRSWM